MSFATTRNSVKSLCIIEIASCLTLCMFYQFHGMCEHFICKIPHVLCAQVCGGQESTSSIIS